MRKVVLLLIGAALTVAMAIGVPGLGPEQQAQALCYSSIDPKCAGPANTQILIQGGVLGATTTGGKIVTSAVKATGSKFNLIASLAGLIEGAVSGIMDLFSVGEDGTRSQGGLSPEGLVGQEISTDEGYVNPSLKPDCSFRSPQPLDAFLSNARCKTVPIYDGQASGFPLAGQVTVYKAGVTTVSGNATLQVTYRYVGSPVLYRPLLFQGICQSSAGVFSAGVASTLTVSATGSDNVQSLGGCPNGGTVVGVVAATTNHAGVPNYQFETVWTLADGLPGDPKPGDPKAMTGTMTASVDCQNSSGVITTITKALAYSVTAGESITVPDAVCPAGTIAVAAGLTDTRSGEAPSVIIPKTNDQITPAVKEMVDKKPGCFTAAEAACLLILYSIGQNGALQSCGNTGELCPDWAKDPDANTRYKCKFGGELVDLRYCSAYRAPLMGILPNVDQNGALLPITAPVPTTVTNPAKNPDGTTKPAEEPESETGDCAPKSWIENLNPFNLFTSMGCALRDAFVPSKAAVNRANSKIEANVKASALGSVGTLLTGLSAAMPTGEGCSGIPWRFSVYGLNVDARLLATCPTDPLHEVAGVVKGILTPLLWTGAVLLWVRYVAGIFGYIPFGSAVSTNPGTPTALQDIGELRPYNGGGSIGRGSGRKGIGS